MMISLASDAIIVVSRSLVASIVAKVTVVTVVGFFAVWLTRRSRAAVRHAFLTAMFSVTLVLPIVSIVAPPVHVVVPIPTESRPAIPSSADAANVISSISRTDSDIRVRAAVPHQPGVSLPVVLLTGWLLGSALSLLPVMTGLWQIRSLRRSSLPWRDGQSVVASLALDAGIHRHVDVFLRPELPGPMTCGVAHPAIVLPLEAEEWNRDDLNRAMVHELEHVRRGDTVTHCLARTACALYWFHPLVWIALRRLVLEAERSCDDAVLRRAEPTAYAAQLVELAKRLATAQRPPFPTMANRFDLGTRVRAVLDVRQLRGRAGALPVALAFGSAVVLAAAISPLALVAAPPQPESAFEVASVKPSPPVRLGDRVYFGPPRGGPGTRDPRRITWTYAAFKNILMAAYNVQTFQIVAPDWISTSRYDIAASVPDGATSEQVPLMWQNLLKERFGVVLHHESKRFQVEELMMAKGGTRLKETDLGPNPDPFVPDLGPPKRNPVMNGFGAVVIISPDGRAQMVAKGLTMADFAVRLGNSFRMPVIDKTGLTGRYDFTLDYTLDLSGISLPPPTGGVAPVQEGPRGDSKPEPGPDLASAVEKQLGLKLNRGRAPLDVIIVDHADKVPTDN